MSEASTSTGVATPPDGADAGNPADGDKQTLEITVASSTVWRIIGILAVATALVWALDQAQDFVTMLVVSVFLSLALLPAVNHLHRKYHWRRGAAVGAIYLGGVLFMVLMIAVLVPSMVKLGDRIADNGSDWLTNANDWASAHLGVNLVSTSSADAAADEAANSLTSWAGSLFGSALSVASSGVGLLFNLATVAMFTFYFTADFHRIRQWVLSFYRPEMQQRLGWTIDEAIRQTGGYFYSRLVLMGINAAGFLLTMIILGVPPALAFVLAIFGGFVSEFIPVIGTYVGVIVPALLTAALSGIISGAIVVVYVVVYQQIENYWLNPRLSAKTMNLNGAVAFGSAILGGALFGPIGAFMALPTAALATSFINNYSVRYPVVYSSGYDTEDDQDDAEDETTEDETAEEEAAGGKTAEPGAAEERSAN